MNTREFDDECLSITELAELVEETSVEAAEHLERCERCRAILASLRESQLSEAPRIELGELPTAEVPARRASEDWGFAEVGALVSPHAPDQRLLCVVLDPSVGNGAFMEVAPVSTEVLFASDRDVVVPSERTRLGYEVMVEVWNHGTVLRSQLTERFGSLGDDAADWVDQLYASIYDDFVEVEGAIEEHIGVPILAASDPRTVFQELEAERARPFWGPAASAMSEEGGHSGTPWEEMTSAAIGDWIEDPFPLEATALALVSAPEEGPKIEEKLVEHLTALVAGGITKLESRPQPLAGKWSPEDLALAAGATSGQEERIRRLAVEIRERVEELRAEASDQNAHQ